MVEEVLKEFFSGEKSSKIGPKVYNRIVVGKEKAAEMTS